VRRLAGDLEIREAAEELAEHDGDLAAGEVGAEAEVGAGPPKPTCGFGSRRTSKRYGSANTVSSRLAEL
jgi:hypothetical protein